MRNVIETRMLSGLQRRGGFGGVADQLNLYNHYVGTPDYLAQDITRRRRVTPDSVRRFVQQYLQPNARVIVHGVPGKQELGTRSAEAAGAARRASGRPGDAINADEPWRAKLRRSRPTARAAQLPTPQSFQLANGLTVLALAADRRLPVVSASLVVRNGERRESDRQAGPRQLFGRDAESGNRDAHRNADRRGYRADWRVASTRARRWTRRRSRRRASRRNFPAALDAPGGRGASIELPGGGGRAHSCGEAGRSRRSSGAIPNISPRNVTAAALYGPSIQYGFAQTRHGRVHQAMTRDDLQGFWRQHFVPGNAALVVAGADHAGRAAQAGGSDVRELAARHGRRPRSSALRVSRAAAGARRSAGLAADAAARRDDSACRARAPTTCRCA